MRDINADPFKKPDNSPKRQLDPVGNPLDFRAKFSGLFAEPDPIGQQIISANTIKRQFEKQIGYLLATAATGYKGDEGDSLAELPPHTPLDSGPEQLPRPDDRELLAA